MNSLRHLLNAAPRGFFAIHQLLALLFALPAAAGPLLSPSTTTYGGIVDGTNFVTGSGTSSQFFGNRWPFGQEATKAVDGVIGPGSKYLNLNITNTALIFSGTTARAADRLELWVAEDAVERDPTSYTLYGTNTAIPALTSGGTFALSDFTQISSGTLALPDTRDTTADATGFSQSIPFPNSTAYASYLLVFPTVKNAPTAANSMQISEVQLYDSAIIGTDSFDYPDGPLANKNGGTFWNWRNQNPAGRTTTGPSDWDATSGTPTVTFGRLVTQNSAAQREYNGPGEGLPITTDEGLGAISAFNNGGLSFRHRTVYYRVTVTTGATLPDSLTLTSSDFATDSVVFGKLPGGSTFAVRDLRSGSATTTSFTAVTANTTYTLVARLDFGNGTTGTASLFLNPDLNAAEPAVPLVTQSFNATFWSSRLKLASTGTAAVTWDDLVIATSWDALGTVVTTTEDEDDGTNALNSPNDISLREAVKYAPSGGLITFDPALSGQTITLTHADGDMQIPQAVTIDATALPGGITVSGNNASRHFEVPTGKSLTLRGLTFTGGNGTSPVGNGNGGAIFSGGTLTLTHCTLSGNSANVGGAILNAGTTTLTQCTLSGNSARQISGAIHNARTMTLTQCTLSGNSARNGGGAISTHGAIDEPGSLTLTQCTLSGNSAGSSGGAIVHDNPLTLTNTIVAGNSAPNGPDVLNNQDTITPNGVNLLGNLAGSGLTAGATVLVGDPRLSPLGYFGGPVQTMHPLIGSPAIDAIVTPDPGGTDARGFPRFVDGDAASAGVQLDIGAVEAGPLRTVSSLIDGNGNALRNQLSQSTAPGARVGFSSDFNNLSLPYVLLLNEITIPAGRSLFIDASNLTGPVTISGNSASPSRVFNIASGATVAMHSLRIINGKAPDGTGPIATASGAAGGGILNGGSLSLFSSTVSGNGAGNGVEATITGNGGAGGNGGGIHSSGALTLAACTVSDNTAGNGGSVGSRSRGGNGGSGGGIHSAGPLTLVACTISGNTAGNGGSSDNSGSGGNGGHGGGIRQEGANSYGLSVCTLAGNQTGNGGDGLNIGSTGTGGGISGGNAILENCLIGLNTQGPSTPDDVNVSVITYLGANLLSVNATGTGTSPALIINPNPLLAPLGDYGGPTQTMPLLAGSPARDAATGSTRRTDQRGFPLFGLPDIGAYEAQQLASIPNLTTDEDSPVTSADFAVGQTGTLSGTSSNTALVPNANITFSGSGATRSVTVTPAANQNGTATITVTDSFGAPEQTFTVTVNAVNDVPIISNLTDQIISEDGNTGPLAFTVSDAETAPGSLTVSAASSNTALVPVANITFTGSGTNRQVTVTPAPNQSGSAFITITVSDGTVTDQDNFLVNVTAVNDAPTITNIADRTVLEDATTGAVAFTIGDVETAAGSLTVAGISNNLTLVPNANITFGGSGASRTVTVTPAANQNGTAVIAVSVSDGTSPTLDTFQLTVTAVNDAPSFTKGTDISVANTAGAQTRTGWATALSAGPADESAQTLSFTVTNANNTLFTVQPAIAANGTLTFTPAPAANGSAVVTVRINDTGGTANGGVNQSAAQTFTITTTAAPSLVVSSTADTGTGSLRQALANAAAAPGASTVTFAPGFTGPIGLTSEIVITDTAGVTVDTTGVAGGVTISGSNTSRILTVGSGSTALLRSLTLTGGKGLGAARNGDGGAVLNLGTLTLERCTLTGNSAGTTPGNPELGGAIYSHDGAVLTLTQCTLAGNQCLSNRGGAIASRGTLTLVHCTISGNTGRFDSGGVRSEGPTTLTHTIIAGNLEIEGQGDDFYLGATTLTRVGANIVPLFGNDGGATLSGPALLTTDPLLAPLANYGGPTHTMALRPGSPARNAAPTSTVTSDQRGFAIVGIRDIGAYEAGTPGNIAATLAETLPSTGPAGSVTPEADYDSDGESNESEIIAGTLPANPASAFRPVATLDEGDLLIVFATVTGRTYTLQRSDTLAAASWLPTGLAFTGNGTTTAFRIPVTTPNRRFYRVVVSQP